jgi:hypothetical protein
MKAAIIVGCAALLLATGTAHAAPYKWQCGDIIVTETKLTSDHLAELSFTGLYRDLLKKRGFKFQFTKDYMGAKLNGNPCHEVKEEEAK